MTNAQVFLAQAKQAKESGKLSNWEADFVDSLLVFGEPEEQKTKKALNSLSSAQFNKLRDIAKKSN